MKKKLIDINNRIKSAALSCGRELDTIQLIAVTKTKSPELIRDAIDCGLAVFGENYIQEARKKITDLSANPVSWHFIGHLQSNKAKFAVKLFDLIHTVDSIKLAYELNREAEKIQKIQKILLQVNTGMEATKSGVSPDETLQLTREISCFENLKIKGLMTIPPLYNAPERVAPYFRNLRKIRNLIQNENIPNVEMDELSMGMTGDFEVAIQEGATLIRIGTAIFGERG